MVAMALLAMMPQDWSAGSDVYNSQRVSHHSRIHAGRRQRTGRHRMTRAVAGWLAVAAMLFGAYGLYCIATGFWR